MKDRNKQGKKQVNKNHEKKKASKRKKKYNYLLRELREYSYKKQDSIKQKHPEKNKPKKRTIRKQKHDNKH